MAGPTADLPDLPSDADDADALRYAIALSLQDEDQTTAPREMKKSMTSPSTDAHRASTPLGLLSLDRKKMEEERLQRLSKRRRPPFNQGDDDDDCVEVPPPKKRLTVRPKEVIADHASARTVPFPDGVVKRTWARGYPRSPDDMKIEEVFQKDQLELAVLSSFQWDDEWMLSKLNMSKTKLLIIAFAADDAQKEAMRENVPPRTKLCFPPMNGPGSMHSKLQLLKFPGYLRVVIPTGNLVPYDWGETGVMENMIFLIDLPRIAEPTKHHPTEFSTELARFLRAMGVDAKMVDSFSHYDFSRTAQLGFVYTIPGGHVDESRNRVGYCGLGTTISKLGLASTEPIEVDLVCASLGAVTCDLVGALYNACQGDDGMKEFAVRKPASKSTGTPEVLRRHFRVYFPTRQTVTKSRGGRMAGGTICVQAKWWRASSFPRELFRDCINNRDGLLMHSKLLLVRNSQTHGATADLGSTLADEGDNDGPGRPEGWAYVGSANLSESAWGRLVKDRASGKMKISCRNWECGVVIPVAKSAGVDKENQKSGGMSMFRHTVPVPMEVPGREYGSKEEPWFYLEA